MMYAWNGTWGRMLLVMLLNAVVWIGLIGLLIWGVAPLPPTGRFPRGEPTPVRRRQRSCGSATRAARLTRSRSRRCVNGSWQDSPGARRHKTRVNSRRPPAN